MEKILRFSFGLVVLLVATLYFMSLAGIFLWQFLPSFGRFYMKALEVYVGFYAASAVVVTALNIWDFFATRLRKTWA